jgi:hypothetical protein
MNDSDENRQITHKSNDTDSNSGILYQAKNLSYKETAYKPLHGTRISTIMKGEPTQP